MQNFIYIIALFIFSSSLYSSQAEVYKLSAKLESLELIEREIQDLRGVTQPRFGAPSTECSFNFELGPHLLFNAKLEIERSRLSGTNQYEIKGYRSHQPKMKIQLQQSSELKMILVAVKTPHSGSFTLFLDKTIEDRKVQDLALEELLMAEYISAIEVRQSVGFGLSVVRKCTIKN